MRRHVREHNHIQALLATLRRHLDARELDDARSTLASLDARLRGHLIEEELTVFPVVERHVGDARFCVTAALRREHDAIREFLVGLAEAVEAGELERGSGDARELAAMIAIHQHREERALYPIADHASLPSKLA
jgi:hemerythrin-like domain-containing protein